MTEDRPRGWFASSTRRLPAYTDGFAEIAFEILEYIIFADVVAGHANIAVPADVLGPGAFAEDRGSCGMRRPLGSLMRRIDERRLWMPAVDASGFPCLQDMRSGADVCPAS